MFGIASMELSWAYVLCIFASFICVVYGIAKWNSTGPHLGRIEKRSRAGKAQTNLSPGLSVATVLSAAPVVWERN